MLSPTPLAIALMLAGVPVFVALALAAPALWVLSGAYVMVLIGALTLDALSGARLSALRVRFLPPASLAVGRETPLSAEIGFAKGPLPARLDAELDTADRLTQPARLIVKGFRDRTRTLSFPTTAQRRGEARITTLWLRWTGPLGLIAKSHARRLDRTVPVTPDMALVSQEAVRFHDRHADIGQKVELERGAGSEFDALREFTTGMDRRAIDWKQTARHRTLLAKEFRTERNHTLVMAFDTSRLMCEPLNGLSRLDRAIHAGLLLSHVSLRAGDRVALYGFDARPRLPARMVSGTRAFPQLQALAARLDYSQTEANYTLGLAELSASLNRRALVVIFTDFVDTVSAEILVDNLARLSRRHHVLFATFRDPLTTALTDAMPEDLSDVGRAVIAASLETERARVLARLTRLGIDILDADADSFSSRLVNQYLDIKRRDSL
jgi:uncharacterized protein (DUF58 family)